MCSVTYETVAEVFDYNKESGVLYWKKCIANKSSFIGKPAGSKYKNGYLYVRVAGVRYLVHRIIWLIEYKEWPKQIIDHIDGNRTNNLIKNLRDVSPRTNAENKHNASPLSVSGVIGVEKRGEKWISYIYSKGKKYSLGSFNSKLKAEEARAKAKPLFHEVPTNV